MSTPADDAFILDIRRDLERVDPVMTRIITDPGAATEFIRDPSGVLSRLGLHPPASRSTHDRVNRVFYAVLTNAELIQLITELFDTATLQQTVGEQLEENASVYEEGSGDGIVSNSIEFDLAAANYVFEQPDVLRRIYRLTLYDLNNRRLLENVYSTAELDDYIERMIESILERRPIRELPTLEVWEPPHWGIGTGYAIGETEVGPVVTVAVLVEVAAAVTVLVEQPIDSMRNRFIGAVRGDPQAVRSFATSSALLYLAGELMAYVNNFEQR